MKHSKKNSLGKAFTLVELLCVIFIIAALSSIVLPVFINAKLSAKIVSCVSNLRQIGIISNLYQADNDDTYPYGINGVERIGAGPSFGRPAGSNASDYPLQSQAISAYYSNRSIFVCPTDTGRSFLSAPPTNRLADVNDGSSYFCSDLLEGQTSSTWPNPSANGYCSDGSDFWHLGYSKADREAMSEEGKAALSKKNLLFYDGHVKSVKTQVICWNLQSCSP